MPIITALVRLRQENYKFEASLGYIVRPCLKTNEKQNLTVMKIFREEVLY
jgi:hypothetical protein